MSERDGVATERSGDVPDPEEDEVIEIRYRHIDEAWAQALEDLELTVFPTIDPSDLYNTDELRRLARTFPEGNFVAFHGDQVVGMGLGILVEFDFDQPEHTLLDVTGTDGVSNHSADNPWYYGTDISVLEEYRGLGIGSALYDLRKSFVRDNNKAGIVAGGVIPGYADHIATMSAADYVARVVTGELHDPTLTFQLAHGFVCPGAIPNYVHDENVGNWASLIVWHNDDYESDDSE